MKRLFCCCLAAILCLTIGCGSGSSSGKGDAPVPDFAINVSVSSLTLTAGSSGSFKVSLTPINGFNGSVTVQIGGLPSGVTLSPGASFSLSAASPQTLKVTIGGSVAVANYPITVSAVSGTLNHREQLTLSVQAPLNPDFSLIAGPMSLEIPGGSQTSFQLSVQPSGGFAYIEREPPLIQSTPLAADETGRLFGKADHGLSIDDATDLRHYTGSEEFPIHDIVVDPNAGPVNQTQNVQIESQAYNTIPSIWFGPLAASGTTNATYTSTTAPALNQAGPVNVRIDGTDKVQAWIPNGYTYGAMLSDGPDLAGPEAVPATIHLFGYGLGSTTSSGGVTASLGGVAAIITKSTLFPTETSYPFPLWDLSVLVPSTPGGTSDITVQTPWGSTTRTGAYHAEDIQTYPLDGTAYSLAVDPIRNQVYVAVSDHIDVFSLSSRKFLASIQVPTLNKVSQIVSVAITPDGKWLAAANWGDESVAVMDPDHPAGAVAIPVMPVAYLPSGPSQIAATSADQFFVSVGNMATSTQTYGVSRTASKATPNESTTSQPNMFLIDPQAQMATAFQVGSSFGVPPYMSASQDGSRVCFSGPDTPPSVYATATRTITQGLGLQGPFVCAINGNYLISETYSGLLEVPTILDMSLNEIGATGAPDYLYGILAGQGQLGLALDPTGALVYAPTSQGVALLDSHTGQMREFVTSPSSPLYVTYGGISISNDGQGVFLITAGGLTVVHLDSLPIAIGSIADSTNSWTINGTGFVSGTEVIVDGTPTTSTYVSPTQIVVAKPPAWNSLHTVTVANPNGRSYTYGSGQLM